jgi:NitT/TauT family transport system permease protein
MSGQRGLTAYDAAAPTVLGETTPGPALAPPWRRAIRTHALAIILPIAAAAFVLIVWEVLVRVLKVPTIILPSPSKIYETIVLVFPLLMEHSVQTTGESVLGVALATIFGLAIGAAIAYSRIFRAAIYPNMVFFQLIPKVALAPLFIMWLGIGAESRLVFAVFIAFFPIAISAATGLATVDASYVRFCRGLTASDWQIFANVRVPFALPSIFSGIKIGVTMSFIGVIVGEFITSQSGLGYLILFASARAETAVIFASITVLCMIGLAVYGAVVLLEILALRIWGAPYDAG